MTAKTGNPRARCDEVTEKILEAAIDQKNEQEAVGEKVLTKKDIPMRKTVNKSTLEKRITKKPAAKKQVAKKVAKRETKSQDSQAA